MILITEVEVIRPFPLVLDCRLYAMKHGDRLTVMQHRQDQDGDIPPALAKELILRRFVCVPGLINDAEADE